MDQNKYRFYPQSVPSGGDLVMVKVNSVTSMGVYAGLLEYGLAEGMLVLWEITKKRIRSIHQLVKEGQIMSCLVLKVDEEKGYIDLSRRRVTPEDNRACVARYSRSKAVHALIMRTAVLLGYTSKKQVYEFYSNTAWHLDSLTNTPWKDGALPTFYSALRNPHALDTCLIDQQARSVLLNTVQTKLRERQVHIKACISVRCLGPEGVDAVKESLREGLKSASEEFPVKIRYLESPRYSVTLETLSSQTTEAQSMVEAAITQVQRKIIQFDGGDFSMVGKPKATHKKSHQFDDDDGDDEDDEDNDVDEKDYILQDQDYYTDSDNDRESSSAGNEDGNDHRINGRRDFSSEKLPGACGGVGQDSGLGGELTDLEMFD